MRKAIIKQNGERYECRIYDENGEPLFLVVGTMQMVRELVAWAEAEVEEGEG